MTTVTVSRAFKFRLYPTPAQDAELRESERQLKSLWNLAHEQRLLALSRPRGERPGESDAQRGRDLRDQAASAAREWLSLLGAGDTDGSRVALRRARVLVAESRVAFSAGQRSRVTYFRQAREMTELLGERDQLSRVVCCARQEVLRDLDKAWQRFFKKLGGRPHFKLRTDACRIYLSTPKHWRITAVGSKLATSTKRAALTLSGVAGSVGPIELRFDRPFPKDARSSSCHLVRDVDQWYAVFPLTFSTEVVAAPRSSVGINRGAVHAVADSDGRVVDSPAFYDRALGKIQVLAGGLSRKVPFGKTPEVSPTKYRGLDAGVVDALAAELHASPGRVVYEAGKRGGLEAAASFLRSAPSSTTAPALLLKSEGRNREKAKLRLARAHRRVRRQREHFLHGESHFYASQYRIIAIEDWSTKDMTSKEPDEKFPTRRVKRAVNRSILDVGWYELGRQLKYKVEATGGEVREVPVYDPEVERIGISSVCSICGEALVRPASGRRHMRCSCSHSELGDLNAAMNVLVRAENMPPRGGKPSSPKKKATIKIKGRRKRPETTGNPPEEARGGDPSARGPDEAGTHERAVSTTEAMTRFDARHQDPAAAE